MPEVHLPLSQTRNYFTQNKNMNIRICFRSVHFIQNFLNCSFCLFSSSYLHLFNLHFPSIPQHVPLLCHFANSHALIFPPFCFSLSKISFISLPFRSNSAFWNLPVDHFRFLSALKTKSQFSISWSTRAFDTLGFLLLQYPSMRLYIRVKYNWY